MPTSLPVREAWFEVEPPGNGVVRLVEPHVDALIQANAWFVPGRERDLLVDAGNGFASILPALDRLRADPGKPMIAVATHGHVDHAGGLHVFEDRRAHAGDADAIASPHPLLWGRDVWSPVAEAMAGAGYPTPEILIAARPSDGFDPDTFAPTGCSLTRTLTEGDVVDLGDRAFEVLHLPGHTPGSIGLWEASTGTLFSGDAVYLEDPLIDQAPTSNVEDYVATMRRLLDIPARVVHAGHDRSFGREDLIARCSGYVARRESDGIS